MLLSQDACEMFQASEKRSRVENQTESNGSDEVALWAEALRMVNAALTKSGQLLGS